MERVPLVSHLTSGPRIIYMRTIKKIVLGTPFKPDEMSHLLGGDNVNNAALCNCGGNTDAGGDCTSNVNKKLGCSCYGGSSNNNNNSILCKCKDD